MEKLNNIIVPPSKDTIKLTHMWSMHTKLPEIPLKTLRSWLQRVNELFYSFFLIIATHYKQNSNENQLGRVFSAVANGDVNKLCVIYFSAFFSSNNALML